MLSESTAKSSSSGLSIFGSAKPVDVTKKEREIEQKLSKLSVDENRGPRRDDRNYSGDRKYDRKPSVGILISRKRTLLLITVDGRRKGKTCGRGVNKKNRIGPDWRES